MRKQYLKFVFMWAIFLIFLIGHWTTWEKNPSRSKSRGEVRHVDTCRQKLCKYWQDFGFYISVELYVAYLFLFTCLLLPRLLFSYISFDYGFDDLKWDMQTTEMCIFKTELTQ